MFKKLPADASLKDVIAQVNRNSNYLKSFESFCDDGYFEEEFEKLMEEVDKVVDTVEDDAEEDVVEVYRVPALPGLPQPPVGFTYLDEDVKTLKRLKRRKQRIYTKL